jgi:tight adherence protein B
MAGLLFMLVFLSFATVGYALSATMRRRQEAHERMLGRVAPSRLVPPRVRGSAVRDRRLSTIAVFDALLESFSATARLVRLIRGAGLSNRAGEVILYVALIGMLAALVTIVFSGNRLLGVGAGLVGAALPLMVVSSRRRKRMRAFGEQLPDALDLVRASLQAGHSLNTAMAVVADEFPDPVAEEFRAVVEETRLGLPLREALLNLRSRIDDDNVPILVVAILIVQEVGGNMAEVLDNVSYTIRERFKLLRDAQVMTAQGRMSARLLVSLPFLVGLVMYFFNPTYFRPMLDSPKGMYMLTYAAWSVAVGYWLIRRIVTIRV